MTDFFKKCLVVTACVWFLLFCFMPRYQTHMKYEQKINVLTGKVYNWGDPAWR